MRRAVLHIAAHAQSPSTHAAHRAAQLPGTRVQLPLRRGYRPGPTNPSENAALLRELEGALKDPDALQRLSTLISPSSARNLSKALSSVQRNQRFTAAAGTKAAAAASSSHPDGTAQNAAAAIAAATSSTEPATVSYQDLKYVALQYGLPFIGFGFVDNAIMILAGDYIDLTLGVSLGISSMAAAGIGNTISDIAGLGLGNVVEDLCARLGLPTPVLTPEQLMLKQTRFAKVVGSSIGITIGCLLGMTPLLFLETREDHAKNKKQDVGSGGARSATIDIHAV